MGEKEVEITQYLKVDRRDCKKGLVMTAIDVIDAIEEIKTKIEKLNSGVEDAASCAAISRRLEGLRSQYREDPAAFEGHISVLKELGGRFEAWLNDNLSLMVDWYHEILVAQEDLNRQKAFLRNRFIMSAERSRDAGDIFFEGKKDVQVFSLVRRLLS